MLIYNKLAIDEIIVSLSPIQKIKNLTPFRDMVENILCV